MGGGGRLCACCSLLVGWEGLGRGGHRAFVCCAGSGYGRLRRSSCRNVSGMVSRRSSWVVSSEHDHGAHQNAAHHVLHTTCCTRRSDLSTLEKRGPFPKKSKQPAHRRLAAETRRRNRATGKPAEAREKSGVYMGRCGGKDAPPVPVSYLQALQKRRAGVGHHAGRSAHHHVRDHTPTHPRFFRRTPVRPLRGLAGRSVRPGPICGSSPAPPLLSCRCAEHGGRGRRSSGSGGGGCRCSSRGSGGGGGGRLFGLVPEFVVVGGHDGHADAVPLGDGVQLGVAVVPKKLHLRFNTTSKVGTSIGTRTKAGERGGGGAAER